MFVLYTVAISLSLLYILLIFYIRRSWNRFPEFIPHSTLWSGKKISVVVAFRNEMPRLTKLIKSLDKQDLPEALWEVVLCDDGSVDGSGEFAESYCREKSRFRYCRLAEGETGKKKAVRKGIDISANDIIVLTDADCTMGEKWLSGILSFYSDNSPDMLIGLVDIKSKGGLAGALEEMEFLSLTGIAAGATIIKRPLFCSGANLAYSKSKFLEFIDPLREEVASGDDTFFMHRLKADTAGAIMLLKSRESVVSTCGADSIMDFLHQRSRWASKSVHYRDKDTIFTALTVFLLNVFMLLSFAAVFFDSGFIYLFPVIFLMKSLADYFFLRDVLAFFGKRINPAFFIAAELIYPVYSVFTPLKPVFSGYVWKGRKY